MSYVPALDDCFWPDPVRRRGMDEALFFGEGVRVLSERCGNLFADWVLRRIDGREGKYALLAACVVAAETAGYGRRATDAVCVLLGVPVPAPAEVSHHLKDNPHPRYLEDRPREAPP